MLLLIYFKNKISFIITRFIVDQKLRICIYLKALFKIYRLIYIFKKNVNQMLDFERV